MCDELAGLDAAGGERRRIAREAHDIVATRLNIMILSTGRRAAVLDSNPPAAQELLPRPRKSGAARSAISTWRSGLVDQSPDLAPQQGLADLDELVDRLTRAGLDIERHVEGEPRTLPRLVDWSAYRIIQEALTNVVKHSASAADTYRHLVPPYSVHLTIADEGAADARPAGVERPARTRTRGDARARRRTRRAHRDGSRARKRVSGERRTADERG